MAAAAVISLSPQVQAQRFDSVYIDLDRDCRKVTGTMEAAGEDAPELCTGTGEYRVARRYSAVATHLFVEASNGAFSMPLTAKKSCFQEYGPRIEWRRADGISFAVIARIRCYRIDPDAPESINTRAKSAEYVIVRGLRGQTKISADIDVTRDARANATARQVADTSYRER